MSDHWLGDVKVKKSMNTVNSFRIQGTLNNLNFKNVAASRTWTFRPTTYCRELRCLCDACVTKEIRADLSRSVN